MTRIEDCVLLYVESDDATADLFQKALWNTGVSPQLFRVTDGIEATAFLLRTDAYIDAPRPHLVVLDLKLPRKSGLDVLAELKAISRLRDIPVIVLSSSPCRQDWEMARELGADFYLPKTGNFDEFLRAAELAREMMASALCPSWTVEIVDRQVETQPWIWRVGVLSKAGGWECLFHSHERNPKDLQNALPKAVSIFKDPLTGEQVDEFEACRRQLMRNLGFSEECLDPLRDDPRPCRPT